MSENDSPAGTPGGPVTVPTLDDLPEKMRVHALARLLGRTSREVLAALAELGIEARSAQSSVVRKDAEQLVLASDSERREAMTLGTVSALLPAGADAASDPAPSDDPVSTPVEAVRAVGGPEPGGLIPLFTPPSPLFQAPEPAPRSRARRKAAEPAVVEPVEAVEPDEPQGNAEIVDSGDDEDDDEAGGRRRRRRGRRGRGRGRGVDDSGEDSDDAIEDGAGQPSSDKDTEDTDDSAEGDDTDPAESEGDDGDDSGGSRRRRRRRRRRGSGEDGDADSGPADPPNTITRVRVPRDSREDDAAGSGDGVQSVRGSTRLEAKRQRRRDGRDAGRRRVPILTEAEFLARRESVDRTMVVRERGDRVEIGVLEDDILVEHFVTGGGVDAGGVAGKSIVGNIYLGRVQNVLPSMEAAFVDIGRGRNAVLYAGEVDWDAAGLGGKGRRIEQALSSGDSVLVQVTKDPIGHKGARLTTQLSLAGRFLVYVPSGGAAGISRKLPDVERKRLKDMLKEIVPNEAGVIIRTASEGVSHEALERDVRRLQAQWDVVKAKSEQTGPNKPKAPVLLYEEPDLLVKVVRDQFNEDFSRLVVAGDDAWDTVSNYVGHVAPELAQRLHRHVGPGEVFSDYRIDEQLLKALDRKVWLPSGGTLVIDRTEAMTVIDVNTGKFTGSGGNLEETVTRNNLEAAEEVVRQLRLRDVGGIIVIDFIDMVLEANRDLVLRRLTECLARDRTRHQVAEVTSLGLVQMTRKRVGGGLLEHFSATCEHCRGRGVIIDAEPVTERIETGRGPEREGRRARGGRGRRGSEQQAGDGGRNGQSGEGSAGNGSAGGQPEALDEARAVPGRADDAAVERAAASVPGRADDAAVERAAASVPGRADNVMVGDGTTGPADAVSAEVAPVDDMRTELTSTDPAGSVEVAVSDTPGLAAAATEVPAGRSRRRTRTVGVGSDSPSLPSDDHEATAELNGDGPVAEAAAPKPRRGRVRRTAGAPSVAGGAAVAVVTVPAPAVESTGSADAPVAAPVGVPPQAEPAAVSRPRRTRRAASRPAGPPAAEADSAAVERASASVPGRADAVTGQSGGGDPV